MGQIAANRLRNWRREKNCCSVLYSKGMFRVEELFALHVCLVPDASPDASRLAVSQEVLSGGSVQAWSDYLSVRLHPKSIYVIRQYMHDGYGPDARFSLCSSEQDLLLVLPSRKNKEGIEPSPPTFFFFLETVVV